MLETCVLPASSCEAPTLLQALSGKVITTVTCGSSYSAAVTSTGELYTWGRGNFGRLGHGNNEDHNLPVMVMALRGQQVVDVACGSCDAQTLAVLESGTVEPLLKDHRIGHCQDRWSLVTCSVILKCRSFCQNLCVICQDRWSLMGGFTTVSVINYCCNSIQSFLVYVMVLCHF